MSEPKVLIVGGGYGQLPAIAAIREMGMKSVVVDRDKHAPGMALADIAITIDIVDVDNVLRAAQEHQVCGALTMQSDIGVPTVGTIVDALKLAGSGRAVADRCSNKIATREAFRLHGIPQPNFEIVRVESQALAAANSIGFPCVIKAPDSSGSRGVVKVNSEDKVCEAVAEALRHTRGDSLLVEEFISGVEIGAQAFSIGGSCVSVLLHDDEMSKPPFMIPIGHSFPSSLAADQIEKAIAAIKACVEALGIADGPSNIDLIIDQSGRPRIIEVGARIGATCLPELVFYHTGINWTLAAVQSACGIKPELTNRRLQPCSAYIIESPEDGILLSHFVPPNLANHPDILEWELTVGPGSKVSRLRKGTDRIGKVVTRGISTAQSNALARRFRESIEFEIDKTTNN